MVDDARTRLEQLLDERIVVLDGSWGVLLQGWGLDEADFRGERFAGPDGAVQGDPALVNRPIVSTPKGAALCRPAEIALTLL